MPDNKHNPNFDPNRDPEMDETDKDFGRQGQGQKESQGQEAPRRDTQEPDLPGQKKGDLDIEEGNERKIGSDSSSDVDVRR